MSNNRKIRTNTNSNTNTNSSISDPEVITLIESFLANCKDKELLQQLQNKVKEKNIDIFTYKSKKTDDLPILCYACLTGSLLLTALLLNNFKTNNTVADLRTAYYYACATSYPTQTHIITLLQKNNIQLPPSKQPQSYLIKEIRQNTLLFDACKHGHTDIVKQLLINISKEDLNDTNNEGLATALSAAALFNKSEIVNLLLQAGADVNIQDKGGRTPLLAALKNNNYKIAKQLIDMNADVTLTPKDNQTVLMLVCKGTDRCDERFELVKLIISKIDKKNRIKYIRQRDSKKYNALYCFASATKPNNSCAIAELLLENGADLRDLKDGSLSMLSTACVSGNLNLVKLLMKHHPDMNQADNNNRTALFYACRYQYEDIVQFLLESGAKIKNNIYDLISFAIQENLFNVAKILIQHYKQTTENPLECMIVERNAKNLHDCNWIVKLTEQVLAYAKNDSGFRYFKEICRNTTLKDFEKTELLKLLVSKNEKTYFIASCALELENYGTQFIKKILEIQDAATIQNCGMYAMVNATVINDKDNIEFLLDHGANLSDALYWSTRQAKEELLIFTVLKISQMTDVRPLSTLVTVEDDDRKIERSKLIDDIVELEKYTNSTIKPQNELKVKKSLKKSQEKTLEVEEQSLKHIKVDENIIEPEVIGMKPLPVTLVPFIARDPKDNLKSIKLAFANLIDDSDISWEDQNSERRYIINLPINHDTIKNLVMYLKKNAQKMNINLIILNEHVIHIIVKIDQQIIILDHIKERINKFVEKQIQHSVEPNINSSTEHDATTHDIEHSNLIETELNIENDSTPNPFSFLAEDEIVSVNKINRMISIITTMESRLPLTIEQKRKSQWSITCKLNPYGIGSEMFFTILINSINQALLTPEHQIAKQFALPKNEINIILNLSDKNIQALNENITLIQQTFMQKYTEKLAEIQASKPVEDKSTPVIKLGKMIEEAIQTTPRENQNERKEKKVIVIPPTPYQKPEPKDIEFCELHQRYLHDAEIFYRKTKALIEAGEIERKNELVQLSHHIYIRMLKTVNVILIHYNKLDIACDELERVRLLLTHRLDYMRTLELNVPAYFDSNNHNSLYSLLDASCTDLISHYKKGTEIQPICFSKNELTKLDLQPPKQQAEQIFTQIINTLHELKYKTSEHVMPYHLDSDARAKDQLPALMLHVGFLVRQLREQAYHFCQMNLNITLSFTAYRSSLIAQLEKKSSLHIDAKVSIKSKDATQYRYQQILPHLLEINRLSADELNSALLLLNHNEMLLLCIEFRNFISHKSMEKSLIFERLSPEFYLTVTRHLTQHLLPTLENDVKKMKTLNENNQCAAMQPVISSMFTSQTSTTSTSSTLNPNAPAFVPKPFFG